MGQVNGHEPDDRPLGTRQLAVKLREMADALGPTRPGTCESSAEYVALCEAAGELLESEMLALAVSWGKRFAELEDRLAKTEKRLAKAVDRIGLMGWRA